MPNHQFDIIIIGGGCSGLTAAIYSSRANLQTLVIEGIAPGGQLTLTTEVENYPGFPEGINGPELIKKMRDQAERFGTQFITKNADSVEFAEKIKKVTVENETYETKAVIIATGADTRWLGIRGEAKLRSRGVSSCATCDGAFFKGKDIIVIGGGDSAMEEATFLTKFANKVTVIHRRDELKASKIMQDRAKNNPKISFIWNTDVIEFIGDKSLTTAKLKNVKTGEESTFPCQGAFVAIGHDPATKIFNGKISLDQKGYVQALKHTETSTEGVFVSGDVEDFRYKQAITAAGDGCRAAIDAERYIEEMFQK